MKEISKSSLWVERYRPKCFEDLIIPEHLKTFTSQIKKDGDVSNLIFSGPAGTGKTSLAKSIANELKADVLHMNCSLDNSINDIRYKVQSFATSVSLFSDGKKIAILDEFERLSQQAQDSLKALIEDTEETCRFFFITNNLQKVIPPLISRTQGFIFGSEEAEKKNLVVSMFKRTQFILDNEGIPYNKKVLAEFVAKTYPDFRKTLNELQKFAKSYGEITEDIFNVTDEKLLNDLVSELKAKKFGNIRKIASNIDCNSFYTSFYTDLDEYLDRSCIPDTVVMLAEYCYRDAISTDREINLVAFLVEFTKIAKWR